jgi:hypothetical protein
MTDQTKEPETYRLVEVLRLVEWVSRLARVEVQSERAKSDCDELKSEIRRLDSKIDSLRAKS